MPYKCPEILQLMYEKNLIEFFPSLTTILKIYITLPITICETERNFSKLSIIKNKFRSTVLEVKRLIYRPWIFGTLVDAGLNLERRGRLVWTGPFNIQWPQAKSTENLKCLSSFVNGWIRCLYSAYRTTQVFHFLCIYITKVNRLENISIYYLPLFNSVAKNLFLGRKNIGGAFAPLRFAQCS